LRRSNVRLDEAGQRAADLRWGILGIVAVVVVLLVFGLVHVVKVGVSTFTAELADASSVRVGDDVRVAGITVGDVTSLTLNPDRVEMTFTVDSDVFVGSHTSLEIRMLTVVGGHYVALIPAGTEPLGSATIPLEKVVLPYSLPEVFQDAIKPVREIDGNVLRKNFAVLGESIDKAPKSFDTLVTAVGDMVDILDKQNADVSRTLDIADEYLTSINANKEVLGRLVSSFNTLEGLVETYMAAVGSAGRNLDGVVSAVAPLGQAWDSTIKPMAQPLADALPKLDDLYGGLATLLDSVRGLGAQVRSLITPDGHATIDQSATAIVAPQLCIPVPGRDC
jgi:phospholipid/cholesterol/gamma-HCH transport system substrate-binding protein